MDWNQVWGSSFEDAVEHHSDDWEQGCTAIPIIIEGRFQVFQRFSSSKLVLKTVESCFAALNYYGNGSTGVFGASVDHHCVDWEQGCIIDASVDMTLWIDSDYGRCRVSNVVDGQIWFIVIWMLFTCFWNRKLSRSAEQRIWMGFTCSTLSELIWLGESQFARIDWINNVLINAAHIERKECGTVGCSDVLWIRAWFSQ